MAAKATEPPTLGLGCGRGKSVGRGGGLASWAWQRSWRQRHRSTTTTDVAKQGGLGRSRSVGKCRSQATYYFIAGGCHIALRNYDEAQRLFDQVPVLLEKKKIGGKDLPTEVLIRKKSRFFAHSIEIGLIVSFSGVLYGETEEAGR